ncbi:MAG: hypothetical protein ACO3B3_02635 [Cyanobium sp.]
MQSSPVEPLATSLADLRRSVQALVDSNHQLSQQLVTLKQDYAEIEASLQSVKIQNESLVSERDSLAASVQTLTEANHQFQLEQDRLSQLQASQQNDLELCSRERAELQADRTALQAKLGEQESVAEKMLTAIQNLFPHEHYRAHHPDLSQASPEDLIRHFLDVGQYLDTPPYSQSLLDEISALAQQRDQSMAKLGVLDANFEQMATEIATFKDLFARLISKAAAPSLSSAP